MKTYRSSLTPFFLLRTYCILAASEGAVALIFLLFLPSDPGGRVFGYSYARLAELIAAVIGTLAFILLSFRPPVHMTNSLFNRRMAIPNILFGLLLAGLLIVGWFLIFESQIVSNLTIYQIIRLAPFIIWALLLALQVGVLWFWLWHSPLLIRSPYTLDVVLVAAIFVVGLVSRVMLTGYGLPYQSIWDEPVTYAQALNMLTIPGLRPYSDVPGYGHSSYGDVSVYLTAAAEELGMMEGFNSQQIDSVQAYVSPPQGVATIDQAVNDTGLPLRVPRLVFALINSLLAPLVYVILRRFFGVDPWSACGAALLLAFLSRDVLYYSSYILPDALATTLFTCLLIVVFIAMESHLGRWQPWLISGILGGIIVSTNIRLVTVVSLPFLGLLLARRNLHARKLWKTGTLEGEFPGNVPHSLCPHTYQSFLSTAAVIVAGLMLGVALTSPYMLLDLPNFNAKWTSFSWYHILDWTHRLDSLSFYLRGMFMPGFGDTYIDSNVGSIGMGLPAGVLAAIGLTGLLRRQPRRTLLMLIFAIIQFYMISPIVERYTRHALVLYPIVAIAAGMGLFMIVQAARKAWSRLAARVFVSQISLQKAFPALILGLFMLVYSGQIGEVVRYIQRVVAFQPSQVHAAIYLETTLKPGDKVGILDIIPWVEADLDRRGINYVRIGLHDTLTQWQAEGLTYVVGTDRLQNDFGSAEDTIWASSGGLKRIAEFGSTALSFAGYPCNMVYLYVAPVPSVSAARGMVFGPIP